MALTTAPLHNANGLLPSPSSSLPSSSSAELLSRLSSLLRATWQQMEKLEAMEDADAAAVRQSKSSIHTLMSALRAVGQQLEEMAEETEGDEEGELVAAALNKFRVEHQRLRLKQRQLNLLLRSREENAFLHERRLLLGASHDSAWERRKLETAADVSGAAEEVTDTLRRTKNMMAQEVERGGAVLESLGESNSTLLLSSLQYQQQKEGLGVSGRLLRMIRQMDVTDRLILVLGSAFFLLVCAVIIYSRLPFLQQLVLLALHSIRQSLPLQQSEYATQLLEYSTHQSEYATHQSEYATQPSENSGAASELLVTSPSDASTFGASPLEASPVEISPMETSLQLQSEADHHSAPGAFKESSKVGLLNEQASPIGTNGPVDNPPASHASHGAPSPKREPEIEVESSRNFFPPEKSPQSSRSQDEFSQQVDPLAPKEASSPQSAHKNADADAMAAVGSQELLLPGEESGEALHGLASDSPAEDSQPPSPETSLDDDIGNPNIAAMKDAKLLHPQARELGINLEKRGNQLDDASLVQGLEGDDGAKASMQFQSAATRSDAACHINSQDDVIKLDALCTRQGVQLVPDLLPPLCLW